MKKKLNISFSGGRTSAYMTKMLLDRFSHKYEFLITFANTGKEHAATLDFVRDCDRFFGFKTVWLEAVVSREKGIGTTHKIVTYETASRNAQPYIDVTEKYGVSNVTWQPCTREMKAATMKSYRKSVGFGKSPYAIGIRIDEPRRVKPGVVKEGVVYPLVDWFPTTKQQIISWWRNQKFDLGRELFPPYGLPEHLGNCTTCFKKTFRKHSLVWRDCPNEFDFNMDMEARFGMVGPEPDEVKPRKTFRGNISAQEYVLMLQENRKTDEMMFYEAESECGESCELFPTEAVNHNHT